MEQRKEPESTTAPHADLAPAAVSSANEARWPNHLLPLALVLTLTLVYLPSLSNQLLNWDDPWLITRNTIIRETTFASLSRIFADFSLEARLILGAEYLPVRDLSLWLEMPLDGLSPRALRITNLAYYIGACLALRSYLRRLGLGALSAEVAAFVFALHPVHVESAAWVAGRKDVLALLFVGLALQSYAKAAPRHLTVGLFLLLAYFSKSMSVTAPLLLIATDLWLRRRPHIGWLAGYAAVTALALFAHGRVGAMVGMAAAPLGGSTASAIASMGPVWLRYLWLALAPWALSIVQEVPVRTSLDALSICGWATMLSLGLATTTLALRQRRFIPLALLLIWLGPLAPVSQVLVPLQNRMADRYLVFSVLALALGVALLVDWLAARFSHRAARAASTVVLTWFAFGALSRTVLFGDSAAVFADAATKTRLLATAPYQLGIALEERGEVAAAEQHYREAVERRDGEPSRRATNNLARLYSRSGREAEALTLLERGILLFPGDPKMRMNHVRILTRLGQLDRAREALTTLQRDFPSYDPSAAPRTVGP